ncbi:MAG: hypothetical protein Q9160_004454 [Pyrenula sp. 1 TL-2023]
MAILAQKKLTCFYCGKRQHKNKKDAPDAWRCSNCDAVNHLDKAGQIVDPPAQDDVPAPRYAQPVSRPTSEQTSTGANLFCPTCLKNQQFYTEALGNYLPAPEHPQYKQYEASLDEYKRALEERYPQVCVACETRAIDRIQSAGYAAKTDHLRRLMDRSRSHNVAKAAGWKNFIVALGQLAYYTSLLGQVAWSLPNTILRDENKSTLESLDGNSPASIRECIGNALYQRSLSTECSKQTASLGGISLVLGLLSIWWNPGWRLKLEGRRGSLRGLKDFYQLQVGSLLFRYLAWVWLQDPQTSGLPPSTTRAFHMTLILINTGLILASRMIVRLHSKPAFTWNENVGPLVPESVRLQQIQESKSTFDDGPPATFPISKLTPLSKTSREVHRIPTPPPDDSADAMEWEPSHNIQPRAKPPAPKPSVSHRSPFYGRLPPAPSNRLLNPHPRAADIQERDSIGIPQGFFDPPTQQDTSRGSAQGTSQDFAEPTFFAPSDYSADTGLESIFGKVFSLQEQALGTQDHSSVTDNANEANAPDTSMSDARNSRLHIKRHTSIDSIPMAFAVLLAASFCLLVSVSTFSPLFFATNISTLEAGAALLVGIAAIFALFTRHTTTTDASLYFIELFTALMMFAYALLATPSAAGKFHMLLSGYVSAMAWQEFYHGVAGKGMIKSSSAAWSDDHSTVEFPSSLPKQQHQIYAEPARHPREPPSAKSRLPDTVPQGSPNQGSPSVFTHREPYQHISSLRPRSNSNTSFDSSPDSETSTIVTHTSGFRTPRFQPRKQSIGWSPGAGLRSLNINDGPPSGRLRSREKRF